MLLVELDIDLVIDFWFEFELIFVIFMLCCCKGCEVVDCVVVKLVVEDGKDMDVDGDGLFVIFFGNGVWVGLMGCFFVVIFC